MESFQQDYKSFPRDYVYWCIKIKVLINCLGRLLFQFFYNITHDVVTEFYLANGNFNTCKSF